MSTASFIHQLKPDDLPPEVRHLTARCLVDTIGVAIGGRQTPLSRIIYAHARRQFGGDETRLWFDGTPVSLTGAALAHATTIDALDLHDSCRPVKGHSGVALFPAALGALGAAKKPVDGREFITALTLGYEIATRAGTAQHASVPDYHTSGSWNALGVAAILARWLELDETATRHALGIAEYHGPRSQMMRTIDHPSMVKDGSGWGALAGTSAALLAADGFTGAPALTVEHAEVAPFWESLGQTWSMDAQLFKPYPVCYWAQPALAAALGLQREHMIEPARIRGIRVHTFHEATRLAARAPDTTEAAQYSLPFPLAALLVHGELGAAEVQGEALKHPEVLRLARLVELIEDPECCAAFPERRYARVELVTDRATHRSPLTEPLWGTPEDRPDDAELGAKFRRLAAPLPFADELERILWDIESLEDLTPLLDLLARPVEW